MQPDEKTIDEKVIEPNKTLSEIFRAQRLELQQVIGDDDGGEYYPQEKIAVLLEISQEQLRKKLNRQKRLTRDWLIAICAAHGLDANKSCDALIAGELPRFDESVRRDSFFIQYLNDHSLKTYENHLLRNKGMPSFKLSSIADLNNALESARLSPLEIQRKGKSNARSTIVKCKLPFQEYRSKAIRIIASNGDMYDSLETEYQPNLRCVAAAFLEDKAKRRLLLEAYSDGTLHITEEDAFIPKVYKTIEDTGEYMSLFMELTELARKEKQRVDDLANDTRNYGHRFSANICNDSIHVFWEEYNCSMPERNEYYFMEYIDGHYVLSISHKSLFMQAYLPEEEYRQHYLTQPRTPFKTYNSIKEIEIEMQAENPSYFYLDLLKSRKQAFIRLQKAVEEKLTQIREKEIFIQNIQRIWDNPAEVLHYYGIESEFSCQYDEEYGEIYKHQTVADIVDEDGDLVRVTFQDVCLAFELGFDTIQQICRVKKKKGSIQSVLQ